MRFLSKEDGENVIRAINLAYQHKDPETGRIVLARYSGDWMYLVRMIAIADEYGTVTLPVKVFEE